MTIKTKEISVALDQLMLDPNNYRLDEGLDTEEYSDDQVVSLQNDTKKRLRKSNISELEASIRINGFQEVDRIVVRELKGSPDLCNYLVVEGNRRTAAFKSIIDQMKNPETGDYYADASKELIEKSKNIKVILITGNDEDIKGFSHRLMGIRHVSGPRQWGGYQSAKLIDDMFSSEGQDYGRVADLLGMRPNEARQKHEAYKAFKQMQSDPEFGDKSNTRIFSLFVEMVTSHSEFKNNWLGWNSEVAEFTNKEHLYRIYSAITKNEDGVVEIKNPADMRKVSLVVRNEFARSEFERGVALDNIEVDLEADKRERRIRNFINFLRGGYKFGEGEIQALVDLKKLLVSITEDDE